MAREDYGRIVYSIKPKEKIKFKINNPPPRPRQTYHVHVAELRIFRFIRLSR